MRCVTCVADGKFMPEINTWISSTELYYAKSGLNQMNPYLKSGKFRNCLPNSRWIIYGRMVKLWKFLRLATKQRKNCVTSKSWRYDSRLLPTALASLRRVSSSQNVHKLCSYGITMENLIQFNLITAASFYVSK